MLNAEKKAPKEDIALATEFLQFYSEYKKGRCIATKHFIHRVAVPHRDEEGFDHAILCHSLYDIDPISLMRYHEAYGFTRAHSITLACTEMAYNPELLHLMDHEMEVEWRRFHGLVTMKFTTGISNGYSHDIENLYRWNKFGVMKFPNKFIIAEHKKNVGSMTYQTLDFTSPRPINISRMPLRVSISMRRIWNTTKWLKYGKKADMFYVSREKLEKCVDAVTRLLIQSFEANRIASVGIAMKDKIRVGDTDIQAYWDLPARQFHLTLKWVILEAALKRGELYEAVSAAVKVSRTDGGTFSTWRPLACVFNRMMDFVKRKQARNVLAQMEEEVSDMDLAEAVTYTFGYNAIGYRPTGASLPPFVGGDLAEYFQKQINDLPDNKPAFDHAFDSSPFVRKADFAELSKNMGCTWTRASEKLMEVLGFIRPNNAPFMGTVLKELCAQRVLEIGAAPGGMLNMISAMTPPLSIDATLSAVGMMPQHERHEKWAKIRLGSFSAKDQTMQVNLRQPASCWIPLFEGVYNLKTDQPWPWGFYIWDQADDSAAAHLAVDSSDPGLAYKGWHESFHRTPDGSSAVVKMRGFEPSILRALTEMIRSYWDFSVHKPYISSPLSLEWYILLHRKLKTVRPIEEVKLVRQLLDFREEMIGRMEAHVRFMKVAMQEFIDNPPEPIEVVSAISTPPFSTPPSRPKTPEPDDDHPQPNSILRMEEEEDNDVPKPPAKRLTLDEVLKLVPEKDRDTEFNFGTLQAQAVVAQPAPSAPPGTPPATERVFVNPFLVQPAAVDPEEKEFALDQLDAVAARLNAMVKGPQLNSADDVAVDANHATTTAEAAMATLPVTKKSKYERELDEEDEFPLKKSVERWAVKAKPKPESADPTASVALEPAPQQPALDTAVAAPAFSAAATIAVESIVSEKIEKVVEELQATTFSQKEVETIQKEEDAEAMEQLQAGVPKTKLSADLYPIVTAENAKKMDLDVPYFYFHHQDVWYVAAMDVRAVEFATFLSVMNPAKTTKLKGVVFFRNKANVLSLPADSLITVSNVLPKQKLGIRGEWEAPKPIEAPIIQQIPDEQAAQESLDTPEETPEQRQARARWASLYEEFLALKDKSDSNPDCIRIRTEQDACRKMLQPKTSKPSPFAYDLRKGNEMAQQAYAATAFKGEVKKDLKGYCVDAVDPITHKCQPFSMPQKEIKKLLVQLVESYAQKPYKADNWFWALHEKIAAKLKIRFPGNNFPEISNRTKSCLISMVAGAGKSRYVKDNFNPTTDMYIVRNADMMTSMRASLKEKFGDERRIATKTYESAFAEEDQVRLSNYTRIWIDECFLLPVSIVLGYMAMNPSAEFVLLGDPDQLGYLDDYDDVMKGQRLQMFTKFFAVSNRRTTFRFGPSVCKLLAASCGYVVKTLRKRDTKITISQYSAVDPMLRYLHPSPSDPVLNICFDTKTKEQLNAVHIPCTTVASAQGLECGKVNLFVSPTGFSMSQHCTALKIVALTRASEHLNIVEINSAMRNAAQYGWNPDNLLQLHDQTQPFTIPQTDHTQVTKEIPKTFVRTFDPKTKPEIGFVQSN